ncbi:MAG TPA: hypothetical protein VF950_14670 [Planctomycetota bacterium]
MKRLLPAVLALACALGGCLKFKQEFTLMPDGSGKMQLTIATKPNPAAPVGEGGGITLQEMMSEDPDKMGKEMPGIVAMTRPKEEKKDGWTYLTFSAYFEDFNKVAIKQGEGDDAQTMFDGKFSKQGDGFVFELFGKGAGDAAGPLGGADDAPPEAKAQMEAMLKQLLAGFEMKLGVKLPGAVTEISGFAVKEGREASFVLSEKDLGKAADMKKMEAVKSMKAVSGASQVSEAELAAWKAEVAKAKEEWAVLKKEMKANYEKKKASEK